VVVRSSLTVAVLWLLEIPGLMLAGGILLAWIGYKLLAGTRTGASTTSRRRRTSGAAMRTIVIADAVMGLDNVLAVAGAAHGSVLLVMTGLAISVPIVVWGSTLILHWIERFPSLLYLGGAVLAWTAAKMIADEPLYEEWLDARPGLKSLLFIVITGGVLGLAWLRNRKATKEVLQ
jgi:YjbE family integral membrane protein